MSTRRPWLDRLRQMFVEQGYFSLKPLPKTRAETDLEAEAAQAGAPRQRVRLDLAARPERPGRPDSP